MTRLSTAEKIVGACAIVTVVGAFLPWVSAIFISVRGTETTDGRIVVVSSLVALVLLTIGVLTETRTFGMCASFVTGLVVLVIAVKDMNALAAVGLYLTLVAACIWVPAAAYGFLRRPEPARSGDEAP